MIRETNNSALSKCPSGRILDKFTGLFADNVKYG